MEGIIDFMISFAFILHLPFIFGNIPTLVVVNMTDSISNLRLAFLSGILGSEI